MDYQGPTAGRIIRGVAEAAVNYGVSRATQWGVGLAGRGINLAGDIISGHLNDTSPAMSQHLRGTPTPMTGNSNYGGTPSPSNFASSRSQESAAKRSRTEANIANGMRASSQKVGHVVEAMMKPGYGAELGVVTNVVNAPIKHRTGENPGPAGPRDPFKASLQLYRGLSIPMDFAFRMYLPGADFNTQYPVTRTYVNQFFRHYNSTAYNSTSGVYGPANINWHSTLGPDAALVRVVPGSGGVATPAQATAASTAGLATTFKTPFRVPGNGQYMYTRLPQQMVENLGWAAHPDKVIAMYPGSVNSLVQTNKLVYDNAGTGYDTAYQSCPAQQPNLTQGSPYYYRCQQGKGNITYNFGNDSSVPCVVDIVITKLKQNETWDLNETPNLFEDVIKNGYIRKNSNLNILTTATGLGGSTPQETDCLYNSKVPFIPGYVWKYAANQDGVGAATQFANQPFRSVSRDQFIISAGATRAWSFDLPALDYDPRRMSITEASSATTPHFCNEFTYIVSIAISTPNVPLIERGAPGNVLGDAYTVVDRRGADVAVSVTGVYSEHAYPVYLSSNTITKPLLFGALDQPHYTTTPTTAGTLTFANVANSTQSTRSAAETSALLSVGAVSSNGV